MVTKAGVGMSRNHNPSVAGREAAQQALQKAGVDGQASLMFGSIGTTSAPWCGRSVRLPEVHPSQVVRRRVR